MKLRVDQLFSLNDAAFNPMIKDWINDSLRDFNQFIHHIDNMNSIRL